MFHIFLIPRSFAAGRFIVPPLENISRDFNLLWRKINKAGHINGYKITG
jgi:hypothetical protein